MFATGNVRHTFLFVISCYFDFFLNLSAVPFLYNNTTISDLIQIIILTYGSMSFKRAFFRGGGGGQGFLACTLQLN